MPDAFYQSLASLANREAISMEQLALIALSAQVLAWMTEDDLEERAKVSEQEPEEYDKR